MKKIITQTISRSLALILAVPFLFGAGRALGFSGWNVTRYNNLGLSGASVYSIIENLVFWVLAIFGFIGVIGFVISGVLYLTAAGSAEQEKTAKKAMTMSIIGIVVGLSGLVAVWWVNGLLNASPDL